MLSKCFQKNSTATHVVKLKATKIGTVTVTVLAEADNNFPEECGPETIISKRYESKSYIAFLLLKQATLRDFIQ